MPYNLTDLTPPHTYCRNKVNSLHILWLHRLNTISYMLETILSGNSLHMLQTILSMSYDFKDLTISHTCWWNKINSHLIHAGNKDNSLHILQTILSMPYDFTDLSTSRTRRWNKINSVSYEFTDLTTSHTRWKQT